MSGTVDTRTVEMRFDNKNFESNVKQSMSTLDKLKQKLKLDGASEGLKEVEKSSKKVDFKETNNAITKLEKSFSALETIATGVFLRIGMKAADAGAKILKSFSIDQISAGWNKYAEKTTAVQTIMANLKDDTAKFTDEVSKMQYVDQYLEKLMWFSDETSYNFTDMTGNVGKFIAVGQNLEDSVTAMQGIATWAAMSGQNAQTASRAMYQISQAMGTGSMKIKDWMSIENANMATAQFKELAISIGEAQGKLKKGEVTVTNFRDSLSASGTNGWFDKSVMMEVFETYGVAADRIRQYASAHDLDTSSAIKELEAADEKFANSLGFKAFRAAQEAKTFSEVISATADAASTKWSKFFENIFGNYIEAKELWTGLSEDLYTIFIEPLNGLNDIMSAWKRGYFKNGPGSTLEWAFENGRLDKLQNGFKYVSEQAAAEAVALDSSVYSIQEMGDGTRRLVRTIQNADGSVTKLYKNIFKPGEDLISGREALIGGFKNIMQALFTGYEDEAGNEVLSILQTIKAAFKDIFFPEADEFSIGKKLWELSINFRNFTEKLKPSQETLDKIRNTFKGFFSIFKIAGKIISAVFTPIKNIFKNLLGGNIGKGLLNITDGFSTWLQKLEDFLDKSGKFEEISNGIKNGLDTISTALTGLSLGDLIDKIKTKVKEFFTNFNFEEIFGKISGWIKKINLRGIFNTAVNIVGSIFGFIRKAFTEIRQLETGEISDKLTPIQNFWLGLKNIFKGIKSIIPIIANTFGKVAEFISNLISNISIPDNLDDKFTPLQNFWIGIKGLFDGAKSVLSMLSGPFKKIATFIGDFLSSVSEIVNKNDRVTRAVSRSSKKSNSALDGVKNLLRGILNLVGSLWKVFSIVATLLGNVFSKIAEVIEKFISNPDAYKIIRLITIVGVIIIIVNVLKNIYLNTLWMKESIEAIIDLTEGIGFTLDRLSLSKVFKSIAILIISIGASIALIANSVNKVGMGKVIGIAAILAVFVGAIFAIVYFSDKIFKNADLERTYSIITLVSGFINAVSISLILLSIAFKKMSKVDSTKLGWISLIFGVFIASVTSIAVGIAGLLRNIPSQSMISGLASVSGFMIAVAASLIVLSVAFKKFAEIEFNKETGASFGEILAAFSLFIAGVGGMAVIIAAISKELFKGTEATKGLAVISGFMIAAAASLVILSVAFKKFAEIDFSNTSVGKIGAVFAIFLAAVGGLAALGALLSKVKSSIYGIPIMAGFMVAAALSLGIIGMAFSKLGNDLSPSQLGTVMNILIAFGVIVALLAAIGTGLAATGVGAAGMALVALIIAAIGAACLSAGAGIALFTSSISMLIDSFSSLMESVSKYGPKFIAQIDGMINAVLDSIINSSDKMKKAAVNVITAVAEGFIEAAPIVSTALVYILVMVMKNVSDTINASTDMLSYTIVQFIIKLFSSIGNNIRLYAPTIVESFRQVMEALLEVAIIGLASIVEPWGATGKAIAKKILGWIPEVRHAFETVDPEGDNLLTALQAENIKLAESGVIAGNAITDLTGDIKSLFGITGAFSSNGLFGDGGLFSILFGTVDPKVAIDAEHTKATIEDVGETLKKTTDRVKKESPEMQKALEEAFASGGLDALDAKYKYISSEGARKAAESDPTKYAIETLEDGRQQLRMIGTKYYKEIYDVPDLSQEQSEMEDDLLSPFTKLADSMTGSGSDSISNFISGMRSKFDDLEGTALDAAGILHSILGFSEPKKGPLSDFHTYAPDMIKLWCLGVKDNLHLISSNTDSLTGEVENGFTAALDYISGLIDGGMSDELTIRPVLDLSGIQNGPSLLNSMFAGGTTYPIYSTANLASSAAYGMNSNAPFAKDAAQSVINSGDINNTFNISSNDPNAVAERVSRIINQQVKRKQAVWAN